MSMRVVLRSNKYPTAGMLTRHRWSFPTDVLALLYYRSRQHSLWCSVLEPRSQGDVLFHQHSLCFLGETSEAGRLQRFRGGVIQMEQRYAKQSQVLSLSSFCSGVSLTSSDIQSGSYYKWYWQIFGAPTNKWCSLFYSAQTGASISSGWHLCVPRRWDSVGTLRWIHCGTCFARTGFGRGTWKSCWEVNYAVLVYIFPCNT